MGIDNIEFNNRVRLDFSEASNLEISPRQSIPKDILKSSTVENLISQNEDLMARLKIALRRLSILESDNQKLAAETKEAQSTEMALADQLMIYKQKDQYWKDRLDAIEKEKQVIAEKLSVYKQLEEKFNQETHRYHRYHEKIKTQVKPYINELKSLLKNQELKINELEYKLQHLEASNSQLRTELAESINVQQEQIAQLERKNEELVRYYDEQMTSLAEENRNLKQALNESELKAIKIHSLVESNAVLENELIQMRHHKEELKVKYEDALLKSKESGELAHHENKKLSIENKDLQQTLSEKLKEHEGLQKEFNIINDQLITMRFMWNAKNDEAEKMKKTIEALERLNIDLSQKINELRG